MLVKLLLIALYCLLATPATGAASGLDEPRFDSVGVGVIPRDVVAALAQDKAGLIWIATGDGLVRFDGYRFRPQERKSANPVRRNLGWIRALLPARDGRLWIGTHIDGLAVYDPASEQVYDFGLDNKPRPDDAPAPLPTIRALAEDLDGHIWVGSLGGGLARFDVTDQSFTRFRRSAEAGALPDDRVQSLLIDRSGSLWVGTWNGLSRLTRGSNRFEPMAPRLAGLQVQALHQASDGRIWVGTQSGMLLVIDPATGEDRLVGPAAGALAPARDAISAFAETPAGEIWVGTAAGIDIHDQDLQLLRQLRYDIRKPTSLAGREVTALMLDQAGWLWVGGFGVGLQRHNPNNRSIWLRGADLNPDSPLADPSVRSLLQVDNGEIWAASSSRGGVAVLDASLRVIGQVVTDAGRSVRKGVGGVPKPPSDQKPPQITAMAQTRDGAVWLGADDVIYRFNRDRRQTLALQTHAGPTNSLFAGSDGSLWIATGDGLYRVRPAAVTLERIAVRSSGSALKGEVHVLAEGPDKSLWVGAVKGLFRLPAGQAELDPVESPPAAGLGNAAVAGLLFDAQHNLWVDTAVAGLHRMSRWDGRLASFDRISERHGIVNRPFGVNLMADKRGRIWTQIQVYDPAKDQLTDLTAVDGANLGTGWFGSYTRMTDGRMLFGGSKGVLVVKPELFNPSDYAPRLVVSELRINGLRQSAGQVMNGLQIDPQQRGFSLEFAALDFSDPGRIRYSHRLEGFDSDWITGSSNNRVASYNNLAPGSYVLRVRATNRSGVWSPNELAVPVQVLPAWWQQWWFRVLVLALAASAVFGIVRWRTYRLRLNQLALESKVQQRTAELQRLTLALQESSLTDPLTGLRNRRFLTQHIASDVALTVRAHENHLQHGTKLPNDADLTFFMFDIDHFKDVNDRHGHAAGDAVLMQMRSRLQGVFRDADYLVRWGGEEFLVVARGTSRLFASELAERARNVVAGEPFDIGGGLHLAKTCSIGFASFPLCPRHPTAVDWTAVLRMADASLFAVKHAGRDGWLGVLEFKTDSLQVLQNVADRPVTEWAAMDGLVMACSPNLTARLPQPDRSGRH